MATITQLARQTASNEARLRKLSKDSAGKVLAQLPSDVPVYNLLADIGTTSEVVERASEQGYITPSGLVKQMANNVLEPTFADGRYGLEIYGESTNLVPYSSDGSQTDGTPTVDVDLTPRLAPDGSMDAIRVTNVTGTSFPKYVRSGSEGVTFCGSCWARLVSGTGSWGLTVGSNTDVASGTVEHNSWFRIKDAVGVADANTRLYFKANSTNAVWDLWNFQLEEEASSSSPDIITGATEGTREACNVTADATDWFNLSEGTFVVEFDVFDNQELSFLMYMGDSSSERFTLTWSAGSLSLATIVGGSGVYTALPITSGRHVASFNFISGVINSLCIDGGIVESKTLTAENVFNSRELVIGNNGSNIFHLNSTLYQLQYIPRAVSDEELQALSRRTR